MKKKSYKYFFIVVILLIAFIFALNFLDFGLEDKKSENIEFQESGESILENILLSPTEENHIDFKQPKPLHDTVVYVTHEIKSQIEKLYITDGISSNIIKIQPKGPNSSYFLSTDIEKDSLGNTHVATEIFDSQANNREIKYTSDLTGWTLEDVSKNPVTSINEKYGEVRINIDKKGRPAITIFVYRWTPVTIPPPVNELEIITCVRVNQPQYKWTCKTIEREDYSNTQVSLTSASLRLMDTTINPSTGNLVIAYFSPTTQFTNVKIMEVNENLDKVGTPITIKTSDILAYDLSLSHNGQLPKIVYTSQTQGGPMPLSIIQWPTGANNVLTLDQKTASGNFFDSEVNSIGSLDIVTYMSDIDKISIVDPNYKVNPRNAILTKPEILFNTQQNLLIPGLTINNNLNGVLNLRTNSRIPIQEMVIVFKPTQNGNCGEGIFQNSFQCYFYPIPSGEQLQNIVSI